MKIRKKIPLWLIVIIGFFYWPVVVIWAMCYGAIGGFVFKALASFEDFWVVSLKEFRQWKRYPNRYYEKHIEKLAARQHHRPAYLKVDTTYEIAELKKSYPKAPAPWLTILCFALTCFALTPYRSFLGLIEGPIVAIYRAIRWWNIHISGKDPNYYYQHLLELDEKILKGEYNNRDWDSEFIPS